MLNPKPRLCPYKTFKVKLLFEFWKEHITVHDAVYNSKKKFVDFRQGTPIDLSTTKYPDFLICFEVVEL